MIKRGDAGARIAARVAARTSHDLNNILAVFSGHLYLLRESAESLDEGLDAMDKAVETLQRLSRSLGELGSLSAEPPEDVDINELLRRFAAQDPENTIELDLAENLPSICLTSPNLVQAIGALIANARQASPAGSAIRIATRLEPAGGIRLTIEDSGPGIAAEIRRRNFDPFFSTRGEKGRGIGITVAATAAALCAGSFALEDREGGGTRAVLLLGEGLEARET